MATYNKKTLAVQAKELGFVRDTLEIETFEFMLGNRELEAAIAEAEAEDTSDDQLIDAREALSSLKRKHFGK